MFEQRDYVTEFAIGIEDIIIIKPTVSLNYRFDGNQ